MILLSNPRVVAIIPAFNEDQTVGTVVDAVRVFVSSVVVVNDASVDRTAEEAQMHGATVISKIANAGYEASIESGFIAAVRDSADIILTIDADGQHNPAYIQEMINIIVAGTADVVVGERTQLHRWAEKIFARYTRARWGIPDPLCGLKAYRREIYDTVGHFDSCKSIGTELMMRAKRKGYKVRSLPMETRERADRSRFYYREFLGNMKILRAALRMVWAYECGK